MTSQRSQEILDMVQRDCLSRGIGYHISAGFTVGSGSTESSGYYDDSNKYLAVGTGRPESEWLATLLHEHSHMDQHLTGSTLWSELTMSINPTFRSRLMRSVKDHDAVTVFFRWLETGKVPYGIDLEDACNRVVRLEYDAEQRTVEKILYYNLQDIVNPEEYCQKALAYVFFYYTCMERKEWYSAETAPYRNEAIYSKMPKSLDMNPYAINKEFVKSLGVDFSSAFPSKG